jgi:hypothetical protein
MQRLPLRVSDSGRAAAQVIRAKIVARTDAIEIVVLTPCHLSFVECDIQSES